jgi:hypothetical protein
MVIRIGDTWHCYYTAHPSNRSADYCRTSRNLRTWSEPKIVAQGPGRRRPVFSRVPVRRRTGAKKLLSLSYPSLR